MKQKLPEEFLDRMEKMLGGDEFKLFLASYEEPRHYGLRINTLKIGVEDFLKISPFKLTPIPWTSDGFYYPEGESPGRHPYYHAGLYYIQEPSAMLPAEAADARPGEKVLDLCAAPGGKTVRLAAAMKGQGLLVANDINSERVKALVKNIELCGVTNAVVTNETPETLETRFEGFFDKILVDAPCSGEGMFRKDADAVRSWRKFKCETCAGMQRDILQSADRMLRPGGILIYSTCTFAPEEDELMIAEFLLSHPGYGVLPIPAEAGIQRGRPEWGGGLESLEGTVRLWPHMLKGEGHFVARLQKPGRTEQAQAEVQAVPEEQAAQPRTHRTGNAGLRGVPPGDAGAGGLEAAIAVFRDFEKASLNMHIEGSFQLKGRNLYCLPAEPPELGGIKVAKFGWYLGEVDRGRFEPSHSLAVSLKKGDFKLALDLPAASRETNSYLKGETLILEGEKGYTGVCVDGYTLGWAKQTGGMLKNMYPRGWRRVV